MAARALPEAAAPAPPAEDVAAILDGRAELRPGPLAELAYRRAVLGARWLAADVRRDGSFYYTYDPEWDRRERNAYNAVRHAGTTYSLWQLYDATRAAGEPDEGLRAAAEAATGWIDANSIDLRHRGRAYVHKGRMKLGGQALALVALLERRRVTGDKARDPLIAGLARFMLAMELPKERGRYHQSWHEEKDQLLLTPPSDYYPGEALLALTRLAQQDFQRGPWLGAARRAAKYLIYGKDGDIPAAGKVPREDHWLTMALAELYRLHPDDSYRAVAYLQADAMLRAQHDVDDRHPQKIGASKRSPLNYTSTATKGEAMVAAWALAEAIGDREASDRFAAGARRNAQFRMRVQWLPENAGLFPTPEKLYGAWGVSPAQPWVRIDFVQHNISALLGVWQMTRDGALPIASADKSGRLRAATAAKQRRIALPEAGYARNMGGC